MNTLVFYSIKELKEYLRTAPEEDFIRITIMAEDEDEPAQHDADPDLPGDDMDTAAEGVTS